MEKVVCAQLRWLAVLALALGASACGSGGGSNPGVGGSGGIGDVDAGKDAPDLADDSSVSRDVAEEAGTTNVKLILSVTSLNVTEGSMTPGMLSISLDRPYSDPITVTIISANPNVAFVTPETLTFSPDSPPVQIVRVFGQIDDNTVADTTIITANSNETGSASATVTVDDVDKQGLLATPPTVSMTEGRTETVSFRLAKKPASAVVVSLTSSNPAKLAVGSASLTFNASNYSTLQSVTVTAPQDDDAMAEHETIKATATGAIMDLSVPVEIIDDDAVNIDVMPASFTLEERGNTPGIVSVTLTRAPDGPVTVTAKVPTTGKVTVSPPAVIFTPTNFGTPQTFTIGAVPDDDGRDEVVPLALSGTGITPAPTDRTVTVTVHDIDNQALQVSPLMLSTSEGATNTFTVRLSLKPDGPTSVAVFSQNPGKLTILPPVLSFDPTNYTVPQTVTVQGQEDDDLTSDMVNVTLLGGSGAAMVNVPVTVLDNDQQAVQLVPSGGANPLVMQESPATGSPSTSSLGVRLAYRPSEPITISLTSKNTGASATSTTNKVTVSPSSVTFGPTDFAVPKVVTLTAPHDADMLNETAVITASNPAVFDATLAVNVLDIDLQNIVNDLPTLAVTDPNGSMGVKVWLTVDPATTPVMVTFAASSGKVTLNPTTCTFTSATYSMATTTCQVVATAVHDNDGRNETVTITGTSGALAMRPVVVAVTDSDQQALTLGALTLPAAPFTEGGTATIPVLLALNPVDSVTLNVFSTKPDKFEVSPPSITFSASDFATTPPFNPAVKMITIRALQDDDLAAETADIVVAGAPVGRPDAKATVTALDDDTQAVIITPATVTILESATTQIGVRLAYRPAAGVSVGLASSFGAIQTLNKLGLAPTSLMFDSSNYAANQFVTITGPKDDDMVPDTFTVTATSAGATQATSTVTVNDTDVLSFILTPTTLGPIDEETTATPPYTKSKTFTVKLNVKASAPVMPSLSVPPSGAGSFDAAFAAPCNLLLPSDSCTVNVSAKLDDNALNESSTVTVSAAAVPSAGVVAVSTKDKDTQAIVVSALNVNVHESGSSNSAQVGVHLAYRPASSATISVSVMPALGDGIDVFPTGAPTATTLTFTDTNYAADQFLTVKGKPDSDLRTDPFSIRLAGTTVSVGDVYVSVTEIDDDTQTILVYPASSNVCDTTALSGSGLGVLSEGTMSTNGTLQFCVALSNQPLSNTVVDLVAAGNMALVSLSTTSLQFTTAATDPNTHLGYADKHLVTLIGMQDDDAANGDGTVNLSSSGFAAIRTLTFTTKDNEAQDLTFNPVGPVAPSAGSTTAVTIKPARNPLMSVTVTCGSDNAAVSITTGSTYNFTAGSFGSNSWTNPKTIGLAVGAMASGATAVITCTMDTTPAVVKTLTVNVQ